MDQTALCLSFRFEKCFENLIRRHWSTLCQPDSSRPKNEIPPERSRNPKPVWPDWKVLAINCRLTLAKKLMTFWAHFTKVTFEVKTAEATYFWQRLVKIGLLFSLTFYHTARSLHLHFKATTKQSLITEMNERAENNFSLVQISAKLGQCYKTRWFSLKIYSTKMEANVPNLCGLNRHIGLGLALLL